MKGMKGSSTRISTATLTRNALAVMQIRSNSQSIPTLPTPSTSVSRPTYVDSGTAVECVLRFSIVMHNARLVRVTQGKPLPRDTGTI